MLKSICPIKKSKEIYLIRHGETEENKARVIIGKSDPPLSEESRIHIRSIKVPFIPDIVYSSPQRRASETAVLLFPDFEINMDPDLVERFFGSFEGKPIMEYLYALKDEDILVENGGEPLNMFENRIQRFINKLMNTDADKIAVVSHGALILRTVSTFLGKRIHNQSLENTNLIYLKIDENGEVLKIKYNIKINEMC